MKYKIKNQINRKQTHREHDTEPTVLFCPKMDDGTDGNEQILRDKLARLEQRIAALELENHILRTQLEDPHPQEQQQTGERKPNRVPQQEGLLQCGLTRGEVERYGRQLLLPEITVVGQRRLSQAAVLIVGAGGLGAPSALYLAAAGIGTRHAAQILPE